MDENQDKYIDFDSYFANISPDNDNDNDIESDLYAIVMKREQINENESGIIVDIKIEREERVEEEHLSQKLSQLSAGDQQEMKDKSQVAATTTQKRSTLTPSTTMEGIASPVVKKLKSNEDIESTEWIINYLSSSNGTFDAMLRPLLKPQFRFTDIEDFRQFAVIINQLKCIELDEILWNKYLHSGTGELIKQEDIQSVLKNTDANKLPLMRCWPIEVKIRMIQHHQTTASNPKDIDHESCLNYVQHILKKYHQQTEFYRNQYRLIRTRLQHVITDTIEDAIIKFVRQYGISLYKLSIDKLIARIEFNFKDQLIQLEFNREHPNAYQKQVFENLFQLKRSMEESKLDIAILKQRMAYKQLPKSFDSYQIPTSLKLDSIHNRDMRQNLKDQCEKILQRTTSDMMLVHIAVAETLFHECHNKFDKAISQMQNNQNRDDFYEKFNKKLLDMIDHRFQILDEYLMYCYNLKLRFFVKAPTVVN